MTVYVQAARMSLVLEFLGNVEVDEVSAALEQAVTQRFVLTVEVHQGEPNPRQEDIMVNFAAVDGFTVSTADPRDGDEWDGRLVYSLALREFVESFGTTSDG